MSTVEFHDVSRTYPVMDHPAADGFDLTIADGELLVLVGPSGCIARLRSGMVSSGDRIRLVAQGDDALVSTAARLADLAGVLSAQIMFPYARDEPATPAVIDQSGR